MEKLNLKYLTVEESKKYNYYLIPKALIDNDIFKTIDYGSKILYSLMLSRASLSAKNADKFIDEQGRLYIIYTINQICDDMNCSNKKAVKMAKELDDIGLIEKKRQGLQKPNVIYVKDFSSYTTGNKNSTFQEVSDVHFKKCTIDTSGSEQCTFQEVNDVPFKKCTFDTSRSEQLTLPEVSKVHSSYPNHNYPNHSYLESNLILSKDTEKIRQEIKEQINYSFLIETNPSAIELVNSIYEIILDVITDNQQYIVLGGSKLGLQTIKKRFMQLNENHIDMVLRNIQNTNTEIKNIKKYLLKCLYDIPLTFETQMDNELRSKGLI